MEYRSFLHRDYHNWSISRSSSSPSDCKLLLWNFSSVFYMIQEVTIETMHQIFGLWGQKWIHFPGCWMWVPESALRRLGPFCTPFLLLNPTWFGHRRWLEVNKGEWRACWKGTVMVVMWGYKQCLTCCPSAERFYIILPTAGAEIQAQPRVQPQAAACCTQLRGCLVD